MIQQFHFGYIPKRIKNRVSKRYLYTVFIAGSLRIAKRWKQSKCPLTEDG